MTASTHRDSWPVVHSGQPDRKFSGSRGVRGRIHVPGSTRLIVATDASWKHNRGGFGYVTRNGYWGLAARLMAGPQPLNPISNHGTGALVLELRAVGMVVDDFPGRAVRLLIDSRNAISYLQSWQAGDVERMPRGYSLRPRIQGDGKPTLLRIAESIAGRDDLRFVHVTGHNGHPMNEVADSLASIGRHAIGGKLGNEHAVGERASDLVSAFLGSRRGDLL